MGRWSIRDMPEPRVQELEQGHPWVDHFTAWRFRVAFCPVLCRQNRSVH
jgi:hypothetical protein